MIRYINQKISAMDKSGKLRKYSYMINHHPGITHNILEWAKSVNCYGLPFDELSYLYQKREEKTFRLEDFIYKKFNGSYKGYSKSNKYEKIQEKFLIDDLDFLKNSYNDSDREKQKNCGYLTQKIMENYMLMNSLQKKFPDLPNKRIMIYCFLNGIESSPKCEICGKISLNRKTNFGFRKTCSEICRRKKEQSYKSYAIEYNGESIRVQGYERFVIPKFLDSYPRYDLKIGFEENNPIKYFFGGKFRDYFPDLLIVSENRIIEIKSDYSFLLDYEKNMAKKKACLELGFKFEFHIWSEKEKNTKII